MIRRRAPFVALLGAYGVSIGGTAMSALAVPLLVLHTTHSAARTGIVGFAQMAPYVLALLLTGPLVDRVGLRGAFIGGNALAAVVVGAVAVSASAGVLGLPALAGLMAVAGLARGTADCANGALVPATAVAGEVDLERAAGLNAAANRTAVLVGSPVGGLLVAVAGYPVAIGVDAGTFAVAALLGAIWVRVPALSASSASSALSVAEATVADSAVLDTSVAVPEAPETSASAVGLRRYGQELLVGLRFIAGDRLLVGLILTIAASNVLEQGFAEVMLPVWAQRLTRPGALGIIFGVGAVGSLLGNLLGTWLGRRLSRRLIYGLGYLIGGVPRFAVAGLTGALPLLLAVSFGSELFAGSLNPVIGATAYERVPEPLQARVLGATRASSWIGAPFGSLIAGFAVQGIGLAPAALTFAAIYLLLSLPPFVFPIWHEMRRPTPA